MSEENSKIREEINKEEILELVEKLQQYDNKEGYKLEYAAVKEKLNEAITKLISCGESAIEYLHALIKHEDTWSCTFALDILSEIKSEKSVLPLIHFIKNNEDGDYYEACDDALHTLVNIGEPAIMPLLYEIKSCFRNKEYPGYLVETFTGIKNEMVYDFMKEILQDYINNLEKYDDWLEIDHFIYNFTVQENKEILPALKTLLAMEHLSEIEQREIKSTIECLEDSEKYDEDIAELSKKFGKYLNIKKENVNRVELIEKALAFEEKKEYDEALDRLEDLLAAYPNSYVALLLNARINRKLGKPNLFSINRALEEAKKQNASKQVIEGINVEKGKISQLFQEVGDIPDEELALHFRCNNCSKKQNIAPGIILEMTRNDHIFENEIMCKYCHSNNLELTEDGIERINQQKFKRFRGDATGIVNIGKTVYVENKKMSYKKSYAYLLQRIKQEPSNGELYLRAANSARKANRYGEAISHYQKAIELNPKLIAAYLNLVELYKYRLDYYKMEDAKDKAIFFLKKMREAYDSRAYNPVTLKNPAEISIFIRENEADFGLASEHLAFKKIKEEDIEKTIKKESTLDLDKISKNIGKKILDGKKEGKELLDANKGIMVFQRYLAFDKNTNESKKIDVSSIMPVDETKQCICGSGKILRECCIEHVRKKMLFAADIDYETHSIVLPQEKDVIVEKNYNEAVESFKENPRFYCESETKDIALFLYYGNTFITAKDLGTFIFGTISIKKEKENKTRLLLEALSKNRFDSLNSAVEKHLD